jgi:hypothetical protein
MSISMIWPVGVMIDAVFMRKEIARDTARRIGDPDLP